MTSQELPLGKAANTLSLLLSAICGLTQKLFHDLLYPCPELELLLPSKNGLQKATLPAQLLEQ